MDEECSSCGAPTRADDLVEVRRAFFLDADDPAPEIAEEVERWCSGCRFTYPNAEVAAENPA